MNIDETLRILRKYLETKGIYLQYYSYLRRLYPLSSKHGANLLIWHYTIID